MRDVNKSASQKLASNIQDEDVAACLGGFPPFGFDSFDSSSEEESDEVLEESSLSEATRMFNARQEEWVVHVQSESEPDSSESLYTFELCDIAKDDF